MPANLFSGLLYLLKLCIINCLLSFIGNNFKSNSQKSINSRIVLSFKYLLIALGSYMFFRSYKNVYPNLLTTKLLKLTLSIKSFHHISSHKSLWIFNISSSTKSNAFLNIPDLTNLFHIVPYPKIWTL